MIQSYPPFCFKSKVTQSMKTFPVFIMDQDYIIESFNFPFKCLKYLGQWSFKSENPPKRILYLVYKVIIFLFGWHLVVLGIVDLYFNWNDWKRVILNWSTTIFTLGITIRNLRVLSKSEHIEKLRIQLVQDIQVRDDEEDLEIMKKFQKTLKTTGIVFFTSYVFFYPIWMASSLVSLKWGPRELPFSLWLPLDLEDDRQFALGFIYQAICGTFVVAEAAYADLAMYSLLLQLTGQYAILRKNVSKVNELYSMGKTEEKNKYLLQLLLKKKFKEFLKRQLELTEYVKELEESYNQVMLIQLLGGLVLAIGNGLELILVFSDFGMKIFYQFAFFLVILCDLFICCALADSLTDECLNINKALYNLAWYEMDKGNMKDILLMTMGAQKTPALTVGKMLPLNLKTYLGFIKNLYSWLALFRQLVMKK